MDTTIQVVVKLAIMCLAMGAVMYVMYRNGWMILNAKSAVSFVGANRGKSASFSGCSGYIKRIIRVPADGRYTFTLDSALTKGKMTVSVLDRDRQELLHLSGADSRAVVSLEKQKRYTLVLRFQSATGRYSLHWE